MVGRRAPEGFTMTERCVAPARAIAGNKHRLPQIAHSNTTGTHRHANETRFRKNLREKLGQICCLLARFVLKHKDESTTNAPSTWTSALRPSGRNTLIQAVRPPSCNGCSDVANATGDTEDDAVDDDDAPTTVAAAGCPHGAHHALFRQPFSSWRCAHAIVARCTSVSERH